MVATQLFKDIMKFAAYGFNKSHAVAYALDSYYCAWLMTYFEEEWLCAYLESMEGNPEKRGKAFSEVKALGYKIVPLDINYADKNWTILEGKKFMPSFYSCKGIGESAIDEILANRPYRNLEAMLWNSKGKWQLSKFNKRAFESLVKIKAFASMDIVGEGKMFESYKHMYDTIIPNWNGMRKTLKSNPMVGRDTFRSALVENSGCGNWTRKEVIQNEMSQLGSVNVETIIPGDYIERFEEEGWKPIDEYEQKWFYWFILVESQVRTTKNGRKYLRCKVMGSSGKQEWMNIWGWSGEAVPEPYTVLVSEVSSNAFGKSCNWRRTETFVQNPQG